MGAFRPLIFSLPSDIADKYKNKLENYSAFNNEGLSITSDDNLLIVWVESENYKPTPDIELERIQGYIGAMVKITKPTYAFDAEITDQRLDLYNALKDLNDSSIDSGNYTLINVLDYHSPPTDAEYTLRKGVIELVPKSGIMVGYNGRYNQGFTLRFEEVITDL